MRFSLLVVVTTCLSPIVWAQDVTLSVKTAHDESVITIKNDSNRVVTAFLVSVEILAERPMWARIYYDSYVNWRRESPIPIGGTAQIALPSIVGDPIVPMCRLEAVLFSDGSMSGNSKVLRDMLRRRQIMLNGLREVISTLRYISEQKLARGEAALILNQKRYTSMPEYGRDSFEERLLHDLVFFQSLRGIRS